MNKLNIQDELNNARMSKVRLNEDKITQLSKIVKALKYKPISFNTPDLFPENDEFIYTNYVFFLVAIDHKTHSKKRFEAFVDGKFYHGSDLLYFLARRLQKSRKNFFTAENLVKITAKDVTDIFSINDVTVRNPEQRAMLLKDCARKLIERYEGDFRNLLKLSKGYLISKDGNGLLQQLKMFKAYEDPLMKKSLLLVKILRRQKYFDPVDVENLNFPVDNVLIEIALRSGIVEVREELNRKLDEKDAYILRKATNNAFKLVSKKSKIPPDILDDLLWAYGREVRKAKKIDEIKTTLDDNIENKEALMEFLVFISGFDSKRSFNMPNFPETWYF